MPLTKSAIKKLRKDKKREIINDLFRKKFAQDIKKAEKGKKPEDIKAAISIVDRAVKKNVIHKNKAARLKSKLSKLVKIAGSKKEVSKKDAVIKTKPSKTKISKIKAPKLKALKTNTTA